jgi:catecholate siderophore receptor
MADRAEAPLLSAPPGMLAGTVLGLGMAPAGLGAALAEESGGAERLPTLPVAGEARGGDGYRATLPGLDKLTGPLLETPQSIIALPRQLLDDEGVTTMREALRNVPGVSLAAGEGGQQGDNLSIRGFNAQNDFYLDGMRDFGSYYRDPFNLQSIEVLEGPASVLFGRGSSGGAVNQVSKQPQLAPVTAAAVSIGTDQLYRLTADVNRAIEGVPGAAVRLNVMGNTNGVAGRDNAAWRRFGFAPEVAFGLGTATRLTLDYYHQQSSDTPDYGIPWLNGRPAPVAHENFYGFADDDFFRTHVNIVSAKFEHDFGDALTVTNQFRYGNYHRDLRVTEGLIQNQGIATGFSTKPLSAISVNRNLIGLSSVETLLDDQAYATWRTGTGFVRNSLVAGLELARQTSEPTRYAWPTTATGLLYPNSGMPFTLNATIRSATSTTVFDLAPFVIDTLSLGPHLDLIGAWRWDVYDSDFRQNLPTALSLERNDQVPSYRAAVVYKPADNGSLYFDYGTSFNPSAEALSLSAATAAVAPEKTTTYEVGTKWDVLDRRLSLAGAVYQIRKANARETNPLDPTTNILAGDYRVRGGQVSAAGHLTARWEVFGGYAYNDAEVVASPNPNEVGHAPPNAPRHSFSLFTTYRLPMPAGLADLEVGGGVNYVSARTASSTPVAGTSVILTAPGYVVAQLMAKYPVNDTLAVQLNLTNITDRYFYDQLHPGHVVLGPSRAAMVTVSAKL